VNIKYLSKIDIRNEWNAAKKNNKINFANLSRDIFYKLYNLKFDNISCIDRDDIEYSKQYILDIFRDLMWNEKTNLEEFDKAMTLLNEWADATIKVSFKEKSHIKLCDISM
jgi:hypothetical protein